MARPETALPASSDDVEGNRQSRAAVGPSPDVDGRTPDVGGRRGAAHGPGRDTPGAGRNSQAHVRWRGHLFRCLRRFRALKFVTKTTNRDDPRRRGGIRFDFAAQSLDMHIQGLSVAHIVRTPDPVDQRFPRATPGPG